MKKIKDFLAELARPEFLGLVGISLLSFVGSLFFVGREIWEIDFWKILGLSSIYALFALCFLSFFVHQVYFFRKNKFDFLVFSRRIIGTFLLTEIVWLWGFFQSNHFNYAFKMLAGLFVILFCFYWIFRYKKYSKISDLVKDFSDSSVLSFKKDREFQVRFPKISHWPFFREIFHWFFSQGFLASLVLLLVMFFNLGFGSYHLSKFAAVDEALWTNGRITKFWNNVTEREWEKTRVSDKPGITVAILSGIGLLQVDPKDYEPKKWQGEVFPSEKNIEEMNWAFRFPILLFNCLMLPVFYILLKKLLGQKTALLGLILVGLSPILLGISTIINPDSLLWVFVPLSVLSYFVYLKDGQNKYLYLAGIFAGLSILTKYVANIVFVFFFGLIFLEYIFHNEKYKKIGFSHYFKKGFLDYLVLVFFSILVYYLLLPEAWVRLEVLLEGTLFSQAFEKVWPLFVAIVALVVLDMLAFKNKYSGMFLDWIARFKNYILATVGLVFVGLIILTSVNTYLGMRWYDLEAALASPKSSYAESGFLGFMLANFYSLIFGISPLAFLAMIFGSLYASFFTKKKENVAWIAYLMIFILIYFVASTVNHVASTVRYQIILYPFILILAAYGLGIIVNIEKVKKYIQVWSFCGVVIIISVYSLNFIRPFYFSYASALLPKEYVLNLKDMGDGSYEAAEYLNSLPNANELMVWSDKRGVCNFFVGKCKSGTELKKEDDRSDYFVVSSGRESRTSKMVISKVANGDDSLIRLDKLYGDENPEWKLEIGGRPNNFVKIISRENLAEE